RSFSSRHATPPKKGPAYRYGFLTVNPSAIVLSNCWYDQLSPFRIKRSECISLCSNRTIASETFSTSTKPFTPVVYQGKPLYTDLKMAQLVVCQSPYPITVDGFTITPFNPS